MKAHMTAAEIERVLVQTRFDYRRWLVVPNVAWGFHIHECDLLAISGRGYIHEVEIKISASDLKRDGKKYHGHRDSRVACLWFAVPSWLRELTLALAPERAGVLCIETESGFKTVDQARIAQRNPIATPMTAEQRLAVARLGTLRYWSMTCSANHKVEEREIKSPVRRCRVCGCTDDDCRQCIAKTGEPCHWVEPDLCSACVEAANPS